VPADSLWELASIALTMIGLSGVVALLGRRMHGECRWFPKTMMSAVALLAVSSSSHLA
jgi:hypothetical protein